MGRKATIMTDTLMLLGGSAVGAGLALLFAPQSGRKTRGDIARFGKTMGRSGEKALRDVTDKAADILKSGKQLTQEGKKGLLSAVERGQDALVGRKRKLARMLG